MQLVFFSFLNRLNITTLLLCWTLLQKRKGTKTLNLFWTLQIVIVLLTYYFLVIAHLFWFMSRKALAHYHFSLTDRLLGIHLKEQKESVQSLIDIKMSRRVLSQHWLMIKWNLIVIPCHAQWISMYVLVWWLQCD